MIDEPPVSDAAVPAYTTDAFSFANRFAKLVCDLVCQSEQVDELPQLMDSIS